MGVLNAAATSSKPSLFSGGGGGFRCFGAGAAAAAHVDAEPLDFLI
jgi:hypothetical protein